MTHPQQPGSLRGLDLTLRRRLDALLPGDHEGMRLGTGFDREEVVRYQPGEDVRRVDWNITARTGELHVWRPRIDNQLDCRILLDLSPSMAFGTANQEKRDLAVAVVGAVAHLIDAPGNRLGVTTVGATGITWSAADSPRLAAARLIRSIGDDDQRSGFAPALSATLRAFARRHRRPGLRVVITDFLEPADGLAAPFAWQSPLRQLAARHDVIAVEVTDPRESALPDVGLVTLVDPESGRQRSIWTADPAIRDRFAATAVAHRDDVRRAIAASGAAHLAVDTDRDWLRDLAVFLQIRRRTARSAVDTRTHPR
ncbi:DUF58 domain-containing protein [Gordonia sp. CPCC 205515]|uniref:DUF58 domain-containing protein n=1 Tax=Gordonia sp. CPCC 205515 TaxID=3140791 RepID=UPI003AF3F05C